MKWDQDIWTIAFNWVEEGATLKCSDPCLKGVSINVMELFPSAARNETFTQATPDDIKNPYNTVREKRKASEASGAAVVSHGGEGALQGREILETPAGKRQCLADQMGFGTPEALSASDASVPAPPAGFGGKSLKPAHKNIAAGTA